jgi:hypothetical protein
MFIKSETGVLGYTDLSTVGAITLQGPHHVAKASRTTILLSLMADWNSALLEETEMLAFVQGSIIDQTGAEETGTNLARLWTPMLTAEFLNPLTKLLFLLKLLVAEFVRKLDLIVSLDDLMKNDIHNRVERGTL